MTPRVANNEDNIGSDTPLPYIHLIDKLNIAKQLPQSWKFGSQTTTISKFPIPLPYLNTISSLISNQTILRQLECMESRETIYEYHYPFKYHPKTLYHPVTNLLCKRNEVWFKALHFF